jgi:L-asparaginase
MRSSTRPLVDYFATGGTIASVRDEHTAGATPTLTAKDIAASVPGLAQAADLRMVQFSQQPSSSLTVHDLLRIRDEMVARVDDGVRGFVVSQGTDTIEETAFVLDLLWDEDAPVVVTGAMRNPSAPGADGPANLLAAVRVAAHDAARGLGCLVVLNDEIHAARYVRKAHTFSPSAFQSPLVGPVGWVAEGRPVIAVRPVGRVHLSLPTETRLPPVALIRVGLDDDGRLLRQLTNLDFEGVVIEGFGGGHVTPAMVPLVARLVEEMPVALASRTGVGEVLSETYRFPGSEIELMELGVIRVGALDSLKARLLLAMSLARGDKRDDIAGLFRDVGATNGRVTDGWGSARG